MSVHCSAAGCCFVDCFCFLPVRSAWTIVALAVRNLYSSAEMSIPLQDHLAVRWATGKFVALVACAASVKAVARKASGHTVLGTPECCQSCQLVSVGNPPAA